MCHDFSPIGAKSQQTSMIHFQRERNIRCGELFKLHGHVKEKFYTHQTKT